MAGNYNASKDGQQNTFHTQPSQRYLDSGATTHVTNDGNNITQPSSWFPSQVMVGNGQHVQVNTGNDSIYCSKNKLNLKNILYVSKISHNLVSVFRIALNNNCRIIFDSHVLDIVKVG